VIKKKKNQKQSEAPTHSPTDTDSEHYR
jgi:hypothetical protein